LRWDRSTSQRNTWPWARARRSRRRADDPLNSTLLEVFSNTASGIARSSEAPAEWYVFPSGNQSPSDPTRPVTHVKTAWNNVRRNAKVKGRWHDNRHTLITDLPRAAPGRSDDHGYRRTRLQQMLKHYSPHRMEAKRRPRIHRQEKPVGKNGGGGGGCPC